jgi:hypothetical protein
VLSGGYIPLSFATTFVLFNKDISLSQIYQRIPIAFFQGKKCLMISENVHIVYRLHYNP